MPNIYQLIEKIKETQKSPHINAEEKVFISLLMDGNKDHWRPLAEFAISPTQPEIKRLMQALENEISKTHYLNLQDFSTHFTYKMLLNKCLESFESMLKKMNYLSYAKNKQPKQYHKKIDKFNHLYKETMEQYHGTIMLPVVQGFDTRLGDSRGECLGFVIQWALQILQNKKPFGIDINQPPPFEVIPFNSKAIQKHPHLNHLAKLNSEIARFQQIKKPEEIKTSHHNITFFLEPATISNKLLEHTDKDPNKVYKISLIGGKLGFAGHALGFCKRNGKYHFFDSNSMWVCFDKAAYFQEWLAFYFKAKGYDKLFHEYSINSFELKPSQEQKESSHVVATILLSPILLPVGILTGMYMVVGRPLAYCLLHVKQGAESLMEYFSSEPLQSTPAEQKQMTTKDDAVNFQKHSKIKFINSTYTMAEKLDVKEDQLRQASLNLSLHDNKVMPLFTKAKKEKIESKDQPVIWHSLKIP